jgi:hypothetical protein
MCNCDQLRVIEWFKEEFLPDSLQVERMPCICERFCFSPKKKKEKKEKKEKKKDKRQDEKS